jgi:methylated-DNA-[protein]-cysteine S-methyltransferase
MPQDLFYSVFETTAGWVGVLGSRAGLVRTTIPQPSQREVFSSLGDSVSRATLSSRYFEGLMERFQAYFSGHRVDFPDELDLSGATPFQRSVWQAARLIPFGQTRSYGWLAGQLGSPGAARAVGQALGRNPLPIIIPCHRVLAANGGLGGFSRGLEMKRFLLQLEKVSFANGVI